MNDYPLSIDTALESIAFMIAEKYRAYRLENNPEMKHVLYNEMKELHKELNLIYSADEETRMKLITKIDEVYCPQIREFFKQKHELNYELEITGITSN